MSPTSLIIGAADGKAILQSGRTGNRHGLVAGATGTGKTVTLQVLAEGFARMGTPVFIADAKGDLSGLSAEGKPHPKIDERLARIPLPDYRQRGYPTVFWDVFGKEGHPIRTTVSDMGPLLLSNLLELNDTQTGVLYAAFDLADDDGMLLLDLKDLRSLLSWMGDNAKELRNEYGNITAASLGAIQRRLLVLEQQGAEKFFGEPALELADLMKTDFSGNGVISLLDASQLVQTSPRVYATMLLWLLAELFEQLPEAGDADRPKLVLFFDEAHLLFNRAPRALLDKVEQVVRLIRSKGVGVYFVTQSPTDIPEATLGQLGLKIQHALRAFTPKDRKTIKAVAGSFRPNPAFKTEEVVTNLGIGEALVSSLTDEGHPSVVERTLICPPESKIGPMDAADKKHRIQTSPLGGKYDKPVDRESAFERLKQKTEERQTQIAREQEEEKRQAEAEKAARQAKRRTGRTSRRQTPGEALIKSAARAIGSQVGRQIIRGVLGSLFGRR